MESWTGELVALKLRTGIAVDPRLRPPTRRQIAAAEQNLASRQDLAALCFCSGLLVTGNATLVACERAVQAGESLPIIRVEALPATTDTAAAAIRAANSGRRPGPVQRAAVIAAAQQPDRPSDRPLAAELLVSPSTVSWIRRSHSVPPEPTSAVGDEREVAVPPVGEPPQADAPISSPVAAPAPAVSVEQRADAPHRSHDRGRVHSPRARRRQRRY